MGGTSAVRQAWARVRSRPRLVVGLALANLLLASAAARPLSWALASLLDRRPAATAMLQGHDALAAELLSDHPEPFIAGAAAAQMVLILWGVLAWILAGGILSTLALPSEIPPRGSLRELVGASAEHAWLMLKLGALGLTTRLVPLLLGGAVWAGLKPLLHHRGFSQAATWIGLTALVLALSWSWATVALDYARTIALSAPVRLHRALGRGIRRSLSAPTVSIVLFSLVGFAAVTLMQLALAHRLPEGSGWASFAAFFLRCTAALARTAVSVTALVAAGIAARKQD